MPRLPLCNVLLVCLLVCCCVNGQTLKVGHISAYNFSDESSAALAHYLVLGINASINAANLRGGVRGHRVELVVDVCASADCDYPALLRNMLRVYPDLLCLIAVAGDRENTALIPTLESFGMLNIGALTGSDQTRKNFSTGVMFVRAEARTELIALINYYVVKLHYRRIGIMYTLNMQYGEEKVSEARNILSSMGLELCGTFAYDANFDTNLSSTFDFDAEFARFSSQKPQVVLMFGYLHMGTAKFMAYLAYFLPTVLMGISNALAALPMTIFDSVGQKAWGRVIVAMNLPAGNDTRYSAISHYESDMSALLGYAYKSSTYYDFVPINGWVSAQLAVSVLESATSYTRQGL